MLYIAIIALIVFLVVRSKKKKKEKVNENEIEKEKEIEKEIEVGNTEDKLGSTAVVPQSVNIDNKAKKSAVEQAIIQKMAYSALLDRLIYALENTPEAEWIKVGQYGDNGWRKVIVKPSGVIIEVPGAYQRRDENKFVAVNFEAGGYTQITEHRDQNGKTDVSRSRMCYLYAAAIQMRLQTVLSNCEFSKINNDRDLNELDDDNMLFTIGSVLIADRGCKAEFSYRVPVPTASSLF